MKKKLAGLMVAAILGFPGLAQAGITGDTVNVSYYYPDLATVVANAGTMVVPTQTFTLSGAGSRAQVVRVYDSYFTYDDTTPGAYYPASFNGPVLTDLTSSPFTGVSIDASSSFAGFDLSRLTYDANHIYVNLQSLPGGGHLQVDFNTARNVPEPTTIAIFGLGLLGLALSRRKSAK